MPVTPEWKKSTASGTSGDCVELRTADGLVEVRDSKNPTGPILAFGPDAHRRFIAAIKAGEFDK